MSCLLCVQIVWQAEVTRIIHGKSWFYALYLKITALVYVVDPVTDM